MPYFPPASVLNSASGVANFGSAPGSHNTTTTISATWVKASSIIMVGPLATATSDHDPDDYIADGISCVVANIVNGVSFDIITTAPNMTTGTYNIQAIGLG